VAATAKQLENLIGDMEKNADALTALALFPVKSVDKKVCFILGLALLFKTPYDASQLVAVRSKFRWILLYTGLLLISYFLLSGALDRFTLPLTYHTTSLAWHITIILIFFS
tara:strand:- start:10 stop:342 length:333 start_codon:yes stop_codon:yes gene_type:complete